MKINPLIAASALGLAMLGAGTADAQRWGPRPGWHHWHGRAWGGPGWVGPRWYGRPGPHYGYYGWRGGWYRDCGWRWGPYGHRRAWRCW